jgi:HEPN domain-containing protein
MTDLTWLEFCSPVPSMTRRWCERSARMADVADSIVGFHAQQATEKLIKAVLAARGVTFAKSHVLSYLIGLVEENRIEAPDELSEADALSPWAVEFRYEGEEPPALDRSAALVLVAQLRTWTEREIKTADQPPNPHQRQTDEDQPE